MAKEETTAVTELSKEQKLALFQAWSKAKKQCDDARAKVSAAVQKIHDNLGGGPFKYEGEEFQLVKARGKEGVELRSKRKPSEPKPSEEIG